MNRARALALGATRPAAAAGSIRWRATRDRVAWSARCSCARTSAASGSTRAMQARGFEGEFRHLAGPPLAAAELVGFGRRSLPLVVFEVGGPALAAAAVTIDQAHRARPRARHATAHAARARARARPRRRHGHRRARSADAGATAGSSSSTSTSPTRTASRRSAASTCAIGRGEKVALVGPNGAGKSTLMLHLNGIHAPSHGTVRIGGTCGGPIDASSAIRAEVGLVFQDPDDQLFSPTVFEDVAFGPLHMGMPGRRDPRPGRAGAGRGRAWPASSGGCRTACRSGQRKRVALATVLSMDPSVLVFDEPSAGLDPRGAASSSACCAALHADAARLDPRHAAGRGVLPADGRHGRRPDRRRRPDRPTSWPTTPCSQAHGLERP